MCRFEVLRAVSAAWDITRPVFSLLLKPDEIIKGYVAVEEAGL